LQKGYTVAENLTPLFELPELPRMRPGRNGVNVSWANFATLIILVLSVGAAWQASRSASDANHSDLVQLAKDTSQHLEKIDAIMDDMVKNGHPDHERRIKILEDQKTDQLVIEVKQLAEAVKMQVDAQKNDHDLIVKMAAFAEAKNQFKAEGK